MSIDGWVGDVTYVTVATRGPKRYFDVDAVRVATTHRRDRIGKPLGNGRKASADSSSSWLSRPAFIREDRGGAPPLDWHIDTPDTPPTPRPEGPTMPLEYRVGDVFDRLAEIPDGSVDLIVTSPPFLALRSYLPADHPDKAKEIGSESTPAAFLDTLLALTAEFGRVLAPHGSLCVELGDTYSGGGVGWDTDDAKWTNRNGFRIKTAKDGPGWPLAKSLTGIPTLYPWSLAYGRNLLTGQPSPAGLWRIRNIIVWARPNPPVGALGDKFRPATSYITIACRGAKRFFDLDAVRTPFVDGMNGGGGGAATLNGATGDGVRLPNREMTHAGAPPLDWHTDQHPEDGDWLWKLPTQPYRGAHYATFPLELPTRLIMAMCPLRVCVVCGRPSERITDVDYTPHGIPERQHEEARAQRGMVERGGWSDCGHDGWRTGVVLDPFAGSGTTLEAAQNVGRHAIGIDLDPRNADLATSRVGMFLTTHT